MTVKESPGKSGRTVHEYDSAALGNSESHPAYGQVGFSRITCTPGTRLYGSSLPRHGSYVRLRISRSERSTHLHHDSFFERERLIEVDLSSVQFAELLTGMNYGSGVPCTIRYIGGERIPDVPEDEETLIERVNEDWGKELAEFRDMATALKQRADEVLSKGAVSAKDRKELQHDIMLLEQHVRANFPFVMESFGKEATRIVAAAKAEVDATVTHAVQATGLKELERLRLGDGMPEKKSEDEGEKP